MTSKVWYDFCKWVLLCQKEYRNYESLKQDWYVINYEETSFSNHGGGNGKPLRRTETDRSGGCKEGRIIMDFSLFDAKRAGFEKVIFIIKKEQEDCIPRGSW